MLSNWDWVRGWIHFHYNQTLCYRTFKNPWHSNIFIFAVLSFKNVKNAFKISWILKSFGFWKQTTAKTHTHILHHKKISEDFKTVRSRNVVKFLQFHDNEKVLAELKIRSSYASFKALDLFFSNAKNSLEILNHALLVFQKLC